MRIFLILIAFSLPLAACGKKGALYLPDPAQASATSSSSTSPTSTSPAPLPGSVSTTGQGGRP